MNFKTLTKEELLQEGWKVLNENLGYKNTILFISSIRQVKENPMKDISKHWEGKNSDDLLNELEGWETLHSA